MKALVISGPTASGKTALSVECAKRLNGEIVSADALLVYKGLNIGTAKPSKGEMGGIPHYMIDVVAPTESFSASDYERLALPILEDIIARGKVPVLVGGTSFYLDALLSRKIHASYTSHVLPPDHPCLCLCLGFSQITLITPFLFITLHFSHIGFTEDLTFITNLLSNT